MPKARHRIGTTSFVIPAGWAENVRWLAGRVEDVEILLFERPDRGEPSPVEVAEIAEVTEVTVRNRVREILDNYKIRQEFGPSR